MNDSANSLSRLGRLVNDLLPGPLRTAASALWLVGGAIAASTAILSAAKLGLETAIPYALPGAALVVLAIGSLRGRRWALAITLVLLGALIFDAIGAGVELLLGDAAAKAAQLRQLGIDPTFAVLINFLYATAGDALFAWTLISAWTRRTRSHRSDDRDGGQRS